MRQQFIFFSGTNCKIVPPRSLREHHPTLYYINVNFTKSLLYHILDIAQQFGTFAVLEIEINLSILTKGRSGLFWMRSLYQELLSKFNSRDLYSIRCQDMMKTVFKTIKFETMPKYIHGLFQMRNTERNLRGSRKLVIPYINTTTYGLHSFRYTSANKWNKLTEDLRSITPLSEFRNKICQVSLEH